MCLFEWRVKNAVEQYEEFEAYEQLSLRHVLLEERLHYCALLQSMKPFLVSSDLIVQCMKLSKADKVSLPCQGSSAIVPDILSVF